MLVLTALAMVLISLVRRVGATAGRDPVAGNMICRNCKGKTVRLSFQAGLVDFFWSLISFAPYRCDVCYHRFHARRQ